MKFILFLFIPLLAFADEIEVITLKHRSAQEVLPLLQPVVPGGAVSGMGDQLIVRGSPKEISDLKKVLTKIDREQKRLKITVFMGERLSDLASGAEASGRISSEGSRVGARVYSTEKTRAAQNTHFVQTMEGSRAFIATGEAEPVPSTAIVISPYGTSVVQGSGYRETLSGFDVLPTLSGEEVNVEVSPRYEKPLAEGGEVKRMNTTVRGRLGEWLEIGGAGESQDGSRSGIAAKSVHTRSNQTHIWLKVEETP